MSRIYKFRFGFLKNIVFSVGIAYLTCCLFLYLQQDNFIFTPSKNIHSYPEDRDFNFKYKDVWITVPNSQAKIHGWWFSASANSNTMKLIPNEPHNIVENQTILYLCGRGGNKSYSTNLAKVQGLLQLGFNVLAIDYRGYGQSEGNNPTEAKLYRDSEAAWQYLTQVKKIAPETIVIYGESLGGAVAIDLAVKKTEAKALIVQSSFTSMIDRVLEIKRLRLLPIEIILNQKFDSITKIKSLQIPVLFLHSTGDNIINYHHSVRLYKTAPQPKQLFLVPKGNHFNIYQPNEHSYLKAIANFMQLTPSDLIMEDAK